MKVFLGLVGVMLLACGDVVTNNPDADGTDADGTDATDDAMPVDGIPGGMLTVHVLNRTGDGAPDLNAHVVVHQADGTAIADGDVDVSGDYTTTIPGGGVIVTVVRTSLDTPEQLTSELTSITDVQPGEELTFGLERRVAVSEGGTSSMTATYVDGVGSTGSTFYTACMPNGQVGARGAVGLAFQDGCHGDKFQLLGVSVGPAVPRFAALNDVTYAPNQTFGVGPLERTMSEFTATHQNVPTGISRVATHRRTILDGIAVAVFSDSLLTPPAGTSTLQVPYPAVNFLRAEIVASLDSTDSGAFMQHEVRTPSSQAGLVIDWSALTLPWLDDVRPLKTGLSWTTTFPGGPGDAMIASWRGSWSGTRPTTVTWRYIGPQTDGGLTLPRLPTAFAELDPQAAPGPTMHAVGSAQVNFFDYVEFDTYAEIRPHAENLLGSMLDAETRFGGVGFTRRNASRGDR